MQTANAATAGRVHIPPEAIRDYLLGNPLFHGLSPDFLLPLCTAMVGLEALPKAELLGVGVAVDGVGMILTGRASVEVPFQNGGAFTIDVLAPGSTFGSAGLLSSSLSPVRVVADEPTKALWLPADVTATLFAAAPRFADRLAREVAGQLVRVCALPRGGPATSVSDAIELLEQKDQKRPKSADVAAPPSLPPGQIPFVDVVEADIGTSVASILPGRVIRTQRVLPLRLTENVLAIACVSPKSPAVAEAVRALYPQCRLEIYACAADDFEKVCARLRLDDAPSKDQRQKDRAARGVVTPDSLAYEDPAGDRDIQTRAGNEEAVRLANKIIAAALDRDASDIHIEPAAARAVVRFRVDGHLLESPESLTPAAARLVAARFKVLAGLDLTERKLPQEGRISLQAGTQRREVELRLTTLPMRIGEKIALHIQDQAATVRPIDRVVTDPRALDLLRRALLMPGGCVVVTGEHGSGTTSTLYALIGEKRRTAPTAHILTVEDPVDQRVAGAIQVPVQSAIGFGGTLTAAVKQDPDVLVAGDVRDAACANVVLEAALAGRALLAAVHADGAYGALMRLEALGAPIAKVGQAVSCVVAQRLARRLCTCALAEPPPKALLEALTQRGLMEPGRVVSVGRPVGCDACGGSGVVGRVAVSEVLYMNDDVRAALALKRGKAEVERAAGRAFVPYASSAAQLLAQRVIAPAEALLLST